MLRVRRVEPVAPTGNLGNVRWRRELLFTNAGEPVPHMNTTHVLVLIPMIQAETYSARKGAGCRCAGRVERPN